MIYDKNYIDIKVALINTILINIPENILDVSYSISNNHIKIQFLLIDGTKLVSSIEEEILKSLKNFKVEIKIIYISKSRFNKNKRNWNPLDYTWLDNLLFSKSESS